ncbi:hypothetical protein DRJ17_04030 [Candidatus Woesearchaeota archaeon]|nr:MAG: hypothetical protein DRJ17_04030 [Candidatus Woesearchaeota archaeon]
MNSKDVVQKIIDDLKGELVKIAEELIREGCLQVSSQKISDVEKIALTMGLLGSLLAKKCGFKINGISMIGLTFNMMAYFLHYLIQESKKCGRDLEKDSTVIQILDEFLSAEMVVAIKLAVAYNMITNKFENQFSHEII